ncbi:MAG: hypothetical protein AAGE37_00515 [Pseudomonadota bacterium]
MTSSFSPHISNLLDQFAVPELPGDFADRVVAAAVGQKSLETDPPRRRAWTRLRSGNGNSPWKRTRFYASGLAGMAMLSTAAAAALSLADIPYRIPVVSDLVEQVIPRAEPQQIVENNRPGAVSEPSPLSEAGQDDIASDESLRPRWRDMNREEKVAVVKERIARNDERVQQRRAARGLPPLSDLQLRKRRVMIRQAIKSGAISRPAVRRALRRTAYIKEGQGLRAERSRVPVAPEFVSPPETDVAPGSALVDVPDTSATELESMPESGSMTAEPSQTGELMTDPSLATEQSNVTSSEIEIADQESTQLDEAPTTDATTVDIQDKLPPALRERLRNATPAERRRILREIRSRRQNGQSMREIRQRLRDMRRTGK